MIDTSDSSDALSQALATTLAGMKPGEMLDGFDANNDGGLNLAELGEALGAGGKSGSAGSGETPGGSGGSGNSGGSSEAGFADLLAAYDTDGDGKLDSGEIARLLAALQGKQDPEGGSEASGGGSEASGGGSEASGSGGAEGSSIEEMFAKFDENGDGKLDSGELAKMIAALNGDGESASSSDNEMPGGAMLDKYDENGDGKLDADEIEAYAEGEGLEIDGEQMVQEMDTDGDGSLDSGEIKAAYEETLSGTLNFLGDFSGR